jgi:hypothetical protein
VVDLAELLSAYDRQIRAAEASNLAPGVSAEADGPVVRIVGERRGFISVPADLGTEGHDLAALIARQREFFAARDVAVEWKTRAHDLPAEVFDQLFAAGFQPEEPQTVMIGRTVDLAGRYSLPLGLTIRRTANKLDLEAIAAMESQVWGDDLAWIADDLGGRLSLGSDAVAIFVAEIEGRIVAAAWLIAKSSSDFAVLLGGSTVADWRGRGMYRALVSERAKLAATWEADYLQVDASEDSRPILERLGFVAVTTTTPFVWTPNSAH